MFDIMYVWNYYDFPNMNTEFARRHLMGARFRYPSVEALIADWHFILAD